MLSERAKERRRNDMLHIEQHAQTEQVIRILAIGVMILAKDAMNKLTPIQRFMLYGLVSLAGGAAIILLITAHQIGMALLLMFLIGVVFNEIRHL